MPDIEDKIEFSVYNEQDVQGMVTYAPRTHRVHITYTPRLHQVRTTYTHHTYDMHHTPTTGTLYSVKCKVIMFRAQLLPGTRINRGRRDIGNLAVAIAISGK